MAANIMESYTTSKELVGKSNMTSAIHGKQYFLSLSNILKIFLGTVGNPKHDPIYLLRSILASHMCYSDSDSCIFESLFWLLIKCFK